MNFKIIGNLVGDYKKFEGQFLFEEIVPGQVRPGKFFINFLKIIFHLSKKEWEISIKDPGHQTSSQQYFKDFSDQILFSAVLELSGAEQAELAKLKYSTIRQQKPSKNLLFIEIQKKSCKGELAIGIFLANIRKMLKLIDNYLEEKKTAEKQELDRVNKHNIENNVKNSVQNNRRYILEQDSQRVRDIFALIKGYMHNKLNDELTNHLHALKEKNFPNNQGIIKFIKKYNYKKYKQLNPSSLLYYLLALVVANENQIIEAFELVISNPLEHELTQIFALSLIRTNKNFKNDTKIKDKIKELLMQTYENIRKSYLEKKSYEKDQTKYEKLILDEKNYILYDKKNVPEFISFHKKNIVKDIIKTAVLFDHTMFDFKQNKGKSHIATQLYSIDLGEILIELLSELYKIDKELGYTFEQQSILFTKDLTISEKICEYYLNIIRVKNTTGPGN